MFNKQDINRTIPPRLILITLLFLLTVLTSYGQQQGATLSNPVDAGVYGCGTTIYSDSKSNDPVNGFGDSYGQPSDEIFYRFVLDVAAEVSISTCNSDFDTYLYLLNGTGGLITSVDDNGLLCAGTRASLKTVLNPGTYYAVVEGYYDYYGNIALDITVATSTSRPAGATIFNPIETGPLAGGAPFFHGTNNYPSSCYGNEMGQLSDEVYYRFTLNSEAEVSINTCDSDFDTYLHLLNGNGGLIMSVDDNGPLCSGTRASMQVTLSPGTYYAVVEGYSDYEGEIDLYISVPAAAPPSVYVSQDQNYIATYTLRVSGVTSPLGLPDIQVDDAIRAVQYFDGLGRPLQAVELMAGPDKKDIIQPFAYDVTGRETRKYLPYSDNSTFKGSYRSNAVASQAGFYNSPPPGVVQIAQAGSVTPSFAETRFEPAPFGRVAEQGAPGAAWQLSEGHTVRMEYGLNSVDDAINLYRSEVVQTTGEEYKRTLELDQGEYYETGELHKTTRKDENWAANQNYPRAGTVEEYTDKSGRVVLKRTFNVKNNVLETLSTYYVYDELGNLSYVLPPQADPDAGLPGQAALDNFCYQYRYDGRKRLIEKKLPGKGWEYLVYNKVDKPVMAQDAVQRGKSPQEWTVSRYDALGRVVQTGIYQHTGSSAGQAYRAHHQGQANGQTVLWEARTSTGTGYTSGTYPSGYLSTTLTLNYYDNYENLPLLPGPYNKATMHSRKTHGLPTASRVKVLNGTTGTSDMLWTVSYYDDEGRVVRSFSQHMAGGAAAVDIANYDEVASTYSFAGQVTSTSLTHHVKNSPATVVHTFYEYDHMGRLLRERQSTGGEEAVLLAGHEYNWLGQPMDLQLHSRDNGASFLQSVDYRYNARGWLTGINDRGLTDGEGDLFGMELKYDSDLHLGSVAQYNGNIAEQLWASGSDWMQRGYSYSYDKANRLTQGLFKRWGGSSWNAEVDRYSVWVSGYDRNGNILGLERNGLRSGDAYTDTNRTWGRVDNLSYTYEGNRLVKVDDTEDAVTGPAGDFRDKGVKKTYVPGNASSWEYGYDQNGSLVRDDNKGITGITYNHLSLPVRIEFGTGNSIEYLYTAAGTKLRKTVTQANTVTGTSDYAGGFIYKDNALEFVHTSQGRALYDAQASPQWRYEYHLKDHLGNLRVSFAEPQQMQLFATMESSRAEEEEQEFENVKATRHQDRGRARTGSHSALLGVGRNRPLGPLRRVRLHKGDSLRAEVHGYYEQESKKSIAFSLASWLASGAVAAAAPGGEAGVKNKVLPYLGVGLAIAPVVVQKEKGVPLAYLRYIVYDADSNYVESGFQPLSRNAQGGWEQLELAYVAQQDGYAEVYVANESQEDMWMDDMSIMVSTPMLVQENHYDPWGLNLVGIERQGQPDHRFQYNGKEKQTELGLNWLDYGARMYDAQIGRWHVVDPLAELGRRHSPYNYALNNPIRFIDPDGMWPGSFHEEDPIDFPRGGSSVSRRMGFDKFDDGSRRQSFNPREGREYIAGNGDGGSGDNPSIIGRAAELFREWISQFSPVDDKDALYKDYKNNVPGAVSRVENRETANNILGTVASTEVTPYFTVSIGKQTNEGSGLISAHGSLTFTPSGVYFGFGGDATASSPALYTGVVSASVSTGFIFGPKSGIPGLSIGGGAGTILGVEYSKSVNPSINPSFGRTYSLGAVLTNTPLWFSGNTNYSVPLYQSK